MRLDFVHIFLLINVNVESPNGMINNDLRTKEDIFIGDQPSDMMCALKAGVMHRWLINKNNCKNTTRWAKNHNDFFSNKELVFQ